MVYGDSLSAGYGLPTQTDWVTLLRHRLTQAGYPDQVVNESISGETTAGGRYRIRGALSAHHPAIVILELGANDGLRGLPIASAQDNLAAIITACQGAQAKVLLVGMRLPPNYGPPYTQAFQAMYATLARRYRVPLVPFMMAGFATDRSLFQADNIHPGARAQPLVLANIWKGLAPLLKRPRGAAPAKR